MDLRGVAYGLIAQNGGKKEYLQLKKMHNSETLQQERDRITAAMASFKDQDLLLQTLQFALSEQVRLQDGVSVISAVSSNPLGRKLAWKFVKKSWKLINERYGRGHFMLPRLLEPFGNFHSKVEAEDFETFFKKHSAPAAKRTIKQVLEKIRSNDDWLKRDNQKIREYLVNLQPKLL